MDGDRTPQATNTGPQYNPADQPASLTEPSPLRKPIPDTANQQPVNTGAANPGVPTQGGFYHPEEQTAELGQLPPGEDYDQQAYDPQDQQAVTWTSSGDDIRGWSANWRVKMTLVSLVLAAIIYVITRDLVSTVSVFVAGLLFGFLGARKPHDLHYALDAHGITIGNKRYDYSQFRAFSVATEAATPTINLVPLQRFMPLLAIHFDTSQTERIIDVLSAHLPVDTVRRDVFDSLLNKIKM